MQLLQRLIDGVRSDHAEEEIGGEVAGGRDHVIRQLIDAHHLADCVVHGRVGIATRLDAERDVLDDAQEAIADVHAGMRQKVAAIDRGEGAEKDRNLDGARGVKPAVPVVVELEAGFGVAQGHSDGFGARLLFDLLDLLSQRALARHYLRRGRRGPFLLRHRGNQEYATRGSALA